MLYANVYEYAQAPNTHLQSLDEFLALQGCGVCFVQLVIVVKQIFLDTNLGSFAVPTNGKAVQSSCDLVKTLVELRWGLRFYQVLSWT